MRLAGGTRLLSDARLMRRASRGDQRAFAAIYERYHQSLYRFCLSILGGAEDAQDALQNTMVKALRSLPGEEREIQLKPWLYRIAHNESVELLRRRRPGVEMDPELVAAAGEPAETAALRERLRQLLRDLSALPERQRAALAMRELAGVGFEQIGEAFGTSAAVARQTVYEARLSLRQMEEGREMSCEKVMWQLSEADGRVTRRRDVQAHLRVCRECREFRDSIAERERDLAALAPLPAVASAGILHALLGGGQASASAGLAGAAGAGAGKVVVSSAVVKSVATVAVVATIGASAADRGGLVDLGLPGGKGGSETQGQVTPGAGTADGGSSASYADDGSQIAGRHRVGRSNATARETAPGRDGKTPSSNRGQQTAAEHKADPGSQPRKAHGHTRGTSESAHKGSGRSRGAKTRSHGAAGHAHSGSGKSHKASAGNGASQGQAAPNSGKQEKAPQPAPAEPTISQPPEPESSGAGGGGGGRTESSP